MDVGDTLLKAKSGASVPSAERVPGGKRTILAAVLGAGAAYALLPSPAFRSEAIIGVGDGATPLRAAMVEATASAAVSKPVISQAAASLIDANLPTPAPGLLEKLTVAARLDAAASREARLSELLRSSVAVVPGDAPGVVRVTATFADAAGAARVATAVAEALVSHQEGEAAELRAQRDAEAARQLDALRAGARGAHQKFAALGGTDVDPARTRAVAAAQSQAAQARLDVVRSILAAGTPPISDRHDLPEHVGALQSAYLDLSQKLATARETYGERHTIVISLTDGVKRAGAALTTEWRRLAKVADAELSAARDREAALRKPESASDAAKRDAIETARVAAVAADAVVARAERMGHDVPVEGALVRLLAPAPVPLQANGLALPLRLALSAFAGFAVLFGARRLWRRDAAKDGRRAAATAGLPEPVFFDEDEVSARRVTRPSEPVMSRRIADDGAPTHGWRDVTSGSPLAHRPAQPRPELPIRRHAPVVSSASSRIAASHRAVGADLADSMADVVGALDHIVPNGDLPMVLVATIGESAETTSISEALAIAAAADGLRVLLVEPEGARATLAALAEPEAEPVLVDLFGALRVALPAEGHDGLVHVVPVLRGGAALVARLTRVGEVPLVEDLAGDFDLVVVDGRGTADCAALAGLADAVLRVGRHPSKRDDEQLLSALGVPSSAFIGTIAASTFVPKPTVEKARPPSPHRPVHAIPARVVHRPASRGGLERRRVAAR